LADKKKNNSLCGCGGPLARSGGHAAQAWYNQLLANIADSSGERIRAVMQRALARYGELYHKYNRDVAGGSSLEMNGTNANGGSTTAINGTNVNGSNMDTNRTNVNAVATDTLWIEYKVALERVRNPTGKSNTSGTCNSSEAQRGAAAKVMSQLYHLFLLHNYCSMQSASAASASATSSSTHGHRRLSQRAAEVRTTQAPQVTHTAAFRRLKEAKDMMDAELITEEDYQAFKNAVLKAALGAKDT
jgi:hypothetical protein